MRIAIIHGLGVDDHERKNFAHRWESLLAQAGFGFECVRVDWAGNNSIPGDILGVMSPFGLLSGRSSPKKWAEEVTTKLYQMARVDGILAHSMGTALACHALRRLQWQIPMVSLGTPHGNPIHTSWLHAIGLRSAVPGAVWDCYNTDDMVTSAPLLGHITPTMWQPVRVADEGVRPIGEHSDVMYLQSPRVHEAIEEAFHVAR
jgi:hypothetical protein